MTRFRISKIALILGAPFLASLTPIVAQAGAAFYVDAGGAVTHIHSPDPFYGTGIPSSGTGYGLNLGIFTTFTERSPAINLQFGLEDRYTSTSNSAAGASYQFMAAYPVLRLQVTRLFLSAGVTPLVWRGETLNGVTTSLSQVSSALSYLGEAGLLLPVTPKFSFGISGSGEWVSVGSSSSPRPIMSGNFFMRFYFDFGSGEYHNSSEFHGWRYPFGRDL
jgi:hypothetical protein